MTIGEQLARSIREKCNKLTRAERDELMKRGMELINRGSKQKKFTQRVNGKAE